MNSTTKSGYELRLRNTVQRLALGVFLTTVGMVSAHADPAPEHTSVYAPPVVHYPPAPGFGFFIPIHF